MDSVHREYIFLRKKIEKIIAFLCIVLPSYCYTYLLQHQSLARRVMFQYPPSFRLYELPPATQYQTPSEHDAAWYLSPSDTLVPVHPRVGTYEGGIQSITETYVHVPYQYHMTSPLPSPPSHDNSSLDGVVQGGRGRYFITACA